MPQSSEQLKGDKLWESPEIGINSKFLAHLTAYFTRQNGNYSVPLDFGLAPQVYDDFRDMKTAEKRQEFLLNRTEIIRKWMAAMKKRLTEIKQGLKDPDLDDEEKYKLALEMFEIDRQATEFSKLIGVEYAGESEYFTISRRS